MRDKGGTTLASFTYTRNADNQVASATTTGVPGSSDSYTYSPLAQIPSAQWMMWYHLVH